MRTGTDRFKASLARAKAAHLDTLLKDVQVDEEREATPKQVEARRLAIQRDVNFCVRGDDALPTEVVWDLDRINEVLGNLLSNAFKFTPHGGTVELKLEPVDDAVRVTVHDTGAVF